MSNIQAPGKAKSVGVRAVVTRANGDVEDLGLVSYWDSNPFKMLWRNAGIAWRRRPRFRYGVILFAAAVGLAAYILIGLALWRSFIRALV